MNTCTQTHSGKMFNIFDPQPADICIEDIALSLSLQCRFNGHTKLFYSVAEHSLNCARLANLLTTDPAAILATLLHDAHEAYLGDFPGPWRNHVYFVHDHRISKLKDIALTIDRTIELKLKVRIHSLDFRDLVKHADLLMLYNERRLALENQDTQWESLNNLNPPRNMIFTKLDLYPSGEIIFKFLKLYSELTQCIQSGLSPSELPLLSSAHLRT